MALKKSGVEDVYRRLGERIAALRERHRLTQAQLGTLAGVSSNYLARTEGAYHRANLAKVEAIADALGVSVAALFEDEAELRTPAISPNLLASIASLGKSDQGLLFQLARRLQGARRDRAARRR